MKMMNVNIFFVTIVLFAIFAFSQTKCIQKQSTDEPSFISEYRKRMELGFKFLQGKFTLLIVN